MRRAKRKNEERSQYTDLQAVPDNSQKLIIAWGIGSVLGSFLIAEWVVLAFYPTNRILMAVPLILAFAVIVVSSLAQGETPRSVGIRLDNVWECLRLVLIPMLLVSIILTSVGYRFGTLRGEHGNLIIWIAKLLALALVQQFVLQAYFNRRAQDLLGRGLRSVLLVALLFALIHLPNLYLAIGTFSMGLVWAYSFQIYPNLFVLTLSHAFLSGLLALSLPNWVLNNLRIGFKYFGGQ